MIVKYIFKQHIRLPVSFVWTIMLPAILYLVFKYKDEEIAFLGSYIVFSSYAYGSSLYLMNCRESGFLKCFISNKATLYKFCFALYIVNTVTISVSLISFYAIIYFISSKMYFFQVWNLILFSPILYLISLNLLNFRKESSEVYTVLNVVMIMFIVLPFLDQPIGGWLNHFNPLYLYGVFSKMGLDISYWFSAVTLSIFGMFGLYNFNWQPVEGRA